MVSEGRHRVFSVWGMGDRPFILHSGHMTLVVALSQEEHGALQDLTMHDGAGVSRLFTSHMCSA